MRRWKKRSEFGPGPRALLAGDSLRIFVAKLRLGRRPRGVTMAMEKLAMTMVLMQGADGRLDPSMATLAAKACMHKSTVEASLNRLEEMGFLRRVRRLVRVRDHVQQTSNAYILTVPPSDPDFQAGVVSKIMKNETQHAEKAQQAERPLSERTITPKEAAMIQEIRKGRQGKEVPLLRTASAEARNATMIAEIRRARLGR